MFNNQSTSSFPLSGGRLGWGSQASSDRHRAQADAPPPKRGRVYGRLAALSAALLLSAAANAAEVKDILRAADDFRIYAQSAKVVTHVELYKDNQLDSDRLYHVYVKPGRRSLVLFKTASELGQKMLMLDDKYWLLLPTSKRPLRITASQKLLGEASVGDIATMTWSEDYSGTIVGQETLQGAAATKLELRSAREGTTYDRILLWVRADNFQPLQAELYLASGKLAKVANYELGALQGRPVIIKTYLQDRIQHNRRTVLQYRSIEAAEIPDKLYNPAYLVRENLESW
jgi:outer membrane lipoprotein-sorting protein